MTTVTGRTMSICIMSILICLLAITISICARNRGTENVTSVAKEFVEMLSGGNVSAAVERFDIALKEKIGSEQLKTSVL